MSESAQEKMAQALQDQQAQWGAFATKALDSSMKLFELNLKVAKQSLEDTSKSVRHLLAVKSPQEMLSVDQDAMQDRLNRTLSYASEISAITSALTAEINRVAQEQMANGYEKAAKIASDNNQQSPVQKMFPHLGEVSHGYEQWLDAGKKMMEAFGQGMAAPGADSAPAKKTASKTKAQE